MYGVTTRVGLSAVAFLCGLPTYWQADHTKRAPTMPQSLTQATYNLTIRIKQLCQDLNYLEI